MPTEPLLNLFLEAIEDRLLTITGAPDYWFDLSGTGVVIVGEKATNPTLSPCQVVIGPTALGVDDAFTNVHLQGRTATFYIYVMYAGDRGNYKERLKQTHRIADDVVRSLDPSAFRAAVSALDADRGNRVVDSTFSVGAFTGLEEQGLGSLALQFSIIYDGAIVGDDRGI